MPKDYCMNFHPLQVVFVLQIKDQKHMIIVTYKYQKVFTRNDDIMYPM